MDTLPDSGVRESFSTGSVRDSREKKGRFDLIPPRAQKRLALMYEMGAVKYGEGNFLLGQNFSRMLDSALRHLNQFKEGDQSQDHLASSVFNIMGIMEFQERISEGTLPESLDDMQKVRTGHDSIKSYEAFLESNGLSDV